MSQRDRSITKDGKGWTLAMFCTALKSLLTELKQCYNTHRFQIGAAISASLSNMPDTHIQLLGCWQSNVFKHYIRPPPSQVAKFSKALYWEIIDILELQCELLICVGFTYMLDIQPAVWQVQHAVMLYIYCVYIYIYIYIYIKFDSCVPLVALAYLKFNQHTGWLFTR